MISRTSPRIGRRYFGRAAFILAAALTFFALAPNKPGRFSTLAAAENPAPSESAEDLYQRGVNFHNGTGGVEHDHAQAFLLFSKAAAAGHPRAQVDLGEMYLAGNFVARDDLQAFAWFGKAAAQKNSHAQYHLGLAYETARGVEQDTGQMFIAYRAAARQGEADAQVALGRLYLSGKLIGKNDEEAFAWFSKAAAQEKADAEYYIGYMYHFGRGVKHDHDQAYQWFSKASEHGDADAQNELGDMYRRGDPVPRNYAKAAAFFRKATAQHQSDAQASLIAMFAAGETTASLEELYPSLEFLGKEIRAGLQENKFEQVVKNVASLQQFADLFFQRLDDLALEKRPGLRGSLTELKKAASGIRYHARAKEADAAFSHCKELEAVLAALKKQLES